MSKKGFTLVEVLIAVGILSVAAFAFLPSFTGSLNEKKLQQSVDSARDVLATARNKALTEVGNPGVVETINTPKYKYSGVKFTAGSGVYTSFRSASATKDACANPDMVDSTKSLPNGAVARIASNETPLCVFFAFQTAEAVTTKGVSGNGNAVSCSN